MNAAFHQTIRLKKLAAILLALPMIVTIGSTAFVFIPIINIKTFQHIMDEPPNIFAILFMLLPIGVLIAAYKMFRRQPGGDGLASFFAAISFVF